MCGCIFAFFSMASPRLGFIFLWIFTQMVDKAFSSFWTALVGLIFLPYTSIIYTLVYYYSGEVTGWGWLWVGIAFLIDLGSYAGSGYTNKNQLNR